MRSILCYVVTIFVGVSRQTICAIERGKYSPSLEVAFRIANMLCTSIENLFYYEPGIEGEHEFADGIIVELSWDGDDDNGNKAGWDVPKIMSNETNDGQHVSIRLAPWPVTRTLIWVVAAIHVLNAAAVWLFYRVETSVMQNVFVKLFQVSSEGKIPTWYSSCALLACAVLLFFIALGERRDQNRYVRHWFGLSTIFALMSLDEATSIHEMSSEPVRVLLGTSGPLMFAWVIPAGILLAVFAAVYFRFLLNLERRYRNLFILAGGVYVLGVLGFELIGSNYLSTHGKNLTYGIIATFEEVFEMGGIVIFIYVLLDYLENHVQAVKLSFQA